MKKIILNSDKSPPSTDVSKTFGGTFVNYRSSVSLPERYIYMICGRKKKYYLPLEEKKNNMKLVKKSDFSEKFFWVHGARPRRICFDIRMVQNSREDLF